MKYKRYRAICKKLTQIYEAEFVKNSENDLKHDAENLCQFVNANKQTSLPSEMFFNNKNGKNDQEIVDLYLLSPNILNLCVT